MGRREGKGKVKGRGGRGKGREGEGGKGKGREGEGGRGKGREGKGREGEGPPPTAFWTNRTLGDAPVFSHYPLARHSFTVLIGQYML